MSPRAMTLPEEADFVVVGGGSAGCIVAARLAEAGHRTVLLEAGPADRHPLIHVPAGVRYLLNDPRHVWADATRPDPAAGARAIAWPHGRVLGGSGSINGMNFVRPTRWDLDGWAQAGCPGWDFASMLPHLKALESWAGPPAPHRGRDGPLPVRPARLRLPVTDAFLAAARARGHPLLADVNVPEPLGAGHAQFNRAGRLRASSARTFLPRARRTGRLVVATGAEATGLMLAGGRCTGVRLRLGGAERALRARTEVILSAGTIGSPRLLMLSGIGPGAALAAAGLPVAHHLPGVGENLQDHYGARLSVRLRGAASLNERARGLRLMWEAAKWLAAGTGALTAGVTSAMLFLRSRAGLEAPDLQLLFSPSSFDAERFGALERAPGASVTVCLSRPQSRGRLRLAAPDPAVPPVIEPGYLSAPADLAALLAGFAEARALMATPPIAALVAAETVPGPAAAGAALEDHIRGRGVTIYHPVGTCRMGEGPGAVVDSRLRLRGIAGLRIADASVMPAITTGNTNAAAMAIGLKAAEMILQDRGGGPG